MSRGVVGRLESWVSERWDGPARLRAFLGKPLPRNVSWLHTLGSLVLLYLVVQVVTGILLACYYSPSPDHAYDSVRYVREELTLGWLVHALHKSGASFVLVTAFLHMLRSYFLAAYKKPRELVWCTGVLLFLLLVCLSFSGGLLPYDQRGYWAAVVGIRIAASAPVFGDAINALLTGGYGDIGATTLSRFYIAHVSVLPLLLFAGIGLHLGLLQKVGSAGPLRGPAEPYHSFFPRQAARDMIAAVAGAAALFAMAVLVHFEDSGPAAPEAVGFAPRPEWYFYGHFELLRLFPPHLFVLGSFVLPTLVIAALFLLPFLDRGPHREPGRRKFAVGIGVAGLFALVALTAIGIADEAAGTGIPEDAEIAAGDDPVVRGRALFFTERHDCGTCHMVNGEGGDLGPDLSLAGRRLRRDFLEEFIRQPASINPDTEMPPFIGNQQELEDIISYLLTLQ